jgi:hypothetical protein
MKDDEPELQFELYSMKDLVEKYESGFVDGYGKGFVDGKKAEIFKLKIEIDELKNINKRLKSGMY